MPAIFARALRTNGIKEISHGFSGEKQVISFFSNTRNRSRVCLFLKTGSEQLFFIFKTIMANYGWSDHCNFI